MTDNFHHSGVRGEMDGFPCNQYDDQHYCLKCKKVIDGLENYVVHWRSHCIIPANTQLQLNERVGLLHDKIMEEDSYVNDDVIDLSTSTKRLENHGEPDKSVVITDVNLTSSSVHQNTVSEDHDYSNKEKILGSSAEDYSEVENYSLFVRSRDPSLFSDDRTSTLDHCHQQYIGPSDLFHPSSQETLGGTLFRSLEPFNDQLKSPTDVEHIGYFPRFPGSKYTMESPHYDPRFSEQYGQIHRVSSNIFMSHDSGEISDKNKENDPLPMDHKDEFKKPLDLEKGLPKDQHHTFEEDKKEVCSDNVDYQRQLEDIRQDDFLSSLELTSNVAKKIMKYESDDEEEDEFDDVRPPKYHTGGKWPPGTHPTLPSDGKWGSSPTPEEDDEHHVEFDEVTLDTNTHPPPKSYTKGKWLPGKRLTRVKYGTTVEYFCKACDRALKGKNAYEKHLKSELHFVKENRYSAQQSCDNLNLVVSDNKRPQRAKKLQAHSFLKKTILKLKKKKVNKCFSLIESQDQLLEEMDKKSNTKASMDERGSHDVLPSELYDSDASIGEYTNDIKSNAIWCPICKLSFFKDYCSRHFASLAHIHNELEYRCNPDSETDSEYHEIILKNVDSLIALSHFKCERCNFYTNSLTDLELHLCLHEESSGNKGEMMSMYSCSACIDDNELFSTKELQRHIKTAGHLANVKDEILQAHQVKISSFVKLSCPLCNQSFRFNREYINHRLKCHSNLSFPPFNHRVLSCSECSFQCRGEHQIREHLKIVHKIKPYSVYFCFVCGLRFSSSIEAETHRQSVTHRTTIEKHKGKSTSRRCNFCYMECDDLTALRQHVTENHSQEITPCPYCAILPPLRSDLTSHLRICSKTDVKIFQGKYQCELCQFSNDLYAHVLMHIVFAHGKPEASNHYICHICKMSVQARSVKNHMLVHTGEWKYACKICSRRFAHESWLLSHIHCVHNNGETTGGSEEREVKAYDLNRSRKTINRNILCEICGMTFKTKTSLKRHQHCIHIFQDESEEVLEHFQTNAVTSKGYRKTKENEKGVAIVTPVDEGNCIASLLCDVCGFGYANMTELKSHRLVHRKTTAKGAQHSCPYCSYSTLRTHHLKRHLRLHTGATPFKCPYCNYSANNQENLRKHLLQTQKHSGRFMYECQFCLQKCQGGSESELPISKSSLFGTNYASEFKSHLMSEHQDSFGDRNELLLHIRSYYYSDMDSTYTENPKPFKHRPRKRHSKYNEISEAALEELEKSESKMAFQANQSISRPNPVPLEVLDPALVPSDFGIGVSSSFAVYSEEGIHSALSDTPRGLDQGPDLDYSSLCAFNNSSDSTSPVPSTSFTIPSVIDAQSVDRVSFTIDCSDSVTIDSGKYSLPSTIPQVSSGEAISIMKTSLPSHYQFEVGDGVVDSTAHRNLVLPDLHVSSLKPSPLSSSEEMTSTSARVYVNKFTNRTFIVRQAPKVQREEVLSQLQIYPGVLEGGIPLSDKDQCLPLLSTKSTFEAYDEKVREDCLAELFQETGAGNVAKKYILIIPNNKSIEEQVVDILPSLDQ